MVTGGEAGFHKEKLSFSPPTHTWLKPVNHKEAGEHKLPRRRQPPKQANTTSIPLACPQCNSKRIWKDGLRYGRSRSGDQVQRYLCRDCGFRFSESTANLKKKVNIFSQSIKQPNPGKNLLQTNVFQSEFSLEPAFENFSLKRCENIGSHTSSKQTIVEKPIYSFADYSRDCRVCVSTDEAKNLVTVEPQQEKPEAGATPKPTETDVKSKLVEYAWWMNKQGYSESTIVPRCKYLKILTSRGANLFDPESIKDAIARQKWSEGSKENAVDAYSSFLLMIGGTWQPPRYKRIQKIPFVPTETEIDQLIAACSFRTGTFLQLLKETGARPGEAMRLEWTDLDPTNRSVRISPEKGSNPRMFKVSTALMERLNSLTRNSSKVFSHIKQKSIQRRFQEQRRRTAAKVKNPRLLKITFVTLRHFKATMEYHKTKDILHVMRILGHKNIKNTLVYTHLVDFNDEEFVSKVAWTLEEACRLIDSGFEYVCEMENAKIFRKRK